MSSWEERMADRAKARRATSLPQIEGPPHELHGELPPHEPDTARWWCTSCGLPDAPLREKFGPESPCPRCGSHWRWYGRLADRDGTAADAPDDGTCRKCYQWRRYPAGQEHHGWGWWMTCRHLGMYESCEHACEHHQHEVWLA